MLYEIVIPQENEQNNFYELDKIKNFNNQIVEGLDKKIASAEYELLNLSDMLIVDGDLLEEKN